MAGHLTHPTWQENPTQVRSSASPINLPGGSSPFRTTLSLPLSRSHSVAIMGRVAVVLGLMAAVAAAFWAGAAAQSSCNVAIISLLPCLGFIQGTSPTPSAQCCTQLASVVQSQPVCLCSVLSGGAGVGAAVNQTLALALPGACNVQTPPASLCNATSPSSSPATPPTPPLPSSPASPPTPPSSSAPATPSTPPADGRTKATPPSGGNPSGGSTNRMTLAVFFCTLFAAAFSSGIF